MPMTEKELLQRRKALYLKAESDILHGLTVEIEGMRITRANLETVQKMINNIQNAIDNLNRVKPRSRIRSVIPRE